MAGSARESVVQFRAGRGKRCALTAGEPLIAEVRKHVLRGLNRKENDMKNCLLVTLLCSAVLVSAAFAQQTTLSSNDRPASASQQASSQDFWDGEQPSLGALIFHPMATKEYVRRHVQPIRDRINELDEITINDARTIREVDARAQQGIQLASAKANAADEHATDADNKAQAAHQTLSALDPRIAKVETVVGSLDQYKTGQQTEIRFRPGQTVLSKQAKDALDEMTGQLKGQRGYILEVQGYASGNGQAAIATSRKVADSVVRYLVLNHEIPEYRIYVLGMGNAPTDSNAHGIRVEVSLLKNELEQTAQK